MAVGYGPAGVWAALALESLPSVWALADRANGAWFHGLCAKRFMAHRPRLNMARFTRRRADVSVASALGPTIFGGVRS